MQPMNPISRIFSNLWRVAILVAFVAALGSSCITQPRDPAKVFQKKHFAAENYSYIYPIRLDTYKMLLGDRYAVVDSLAAELKRTFAGDDRIVEYAERILKEQGEEQQNAVQYLRALEEASSGGGVICQFEWSNGVTREIGLLVIKGGDIIVRDVWLTEYLDPEQ
jgi:hypothetical protein